jgi:phosphohistidine swiveling domain-containing protein
MIAFIDSYRDQFGVVDSKHGRHKAMALPEGRAGQVASLPRPEELGILMTGNGVMKKFVVGVVVVAGLAGGAPVSSAAPSAEENDGFICVAFNRSGVSKPEVTWVLKVLTQQEGMTSQQARNSLGHAVKTKCPKHAADLKKLGY